VILERETKERDRSQILFQTPNSK